MLTNFKTQKSDRRQLVAVASDPFPRICTAAGRRLLCSRAGVLLRPGQLPSCLCKDSHPSRPPVDPAVTSTTTLAL
jgi:hypothetical protein